MFNKWVYIGFIQKKYHIYHESYLLLRSIVQSYLLFVYSVVIIIISSSHILIIVAMLISILVSFYSHLCLTNNNYINEFSLNKNNRGKSQMCFNIIISIIITWILFYTFDSVTLNPKWILIAGNDAFDFAEYRVATPWYVLGRLT